MAIVIGLDFGNYYSFPSYIPEEDLGENRFGGEPCSLIPEERDYGYPSLFFYSKDAADRAAQRNTIPPPWCGFAAESGIARPEKNRINNLKRNIGKALKLDDWEKSYDDAIVEVIQYVVRQANTVLKRKTLKTTNLISLAHPSSEGFHLANIQRLKTLAERATLEDGTHLEVVGMIAEPAAASLDYLVAKELDSRETTILTYDLGGGTFDIAVVSAYPNGKINSLGNTYYYDIESEGGLDLGGSDFTEAMFELLKSKIDPSYVYSEDYLRREAERAKRDLSDPSQPETAVEIITMTGQSVRIDVTKEEFDRSVKGLVDRTIELTRNILSNTPDDKKPEIIVLTGGASKMLIIRETLEKEFPEYRDRIDMYRPSRAISYGAARFIQNCPVVQQRLKRDVGISFIDRDTKIEEFCPYISKGTELPASSKWIPSFVNFDGKTISEFDVYEARNDNYSVAALTEDFNKIYSIEMRYPPAKYDHKHLSQISIDETGLLTVKCKDPSDPDIKVEGEVKIDLSER